MVTYNVSDYEKAMAAFDKGDVSGAIMQFERMARSETSVKKLAILALGHVFETHGVNQDYSKACHYYEWAEELGMADASRRLGSVYRRLGRLPKSLAKYKEVAKTNPSAAYWVYDILSKNENLKSDDDEAEKYLEFAAGRGSIFAKQVKVLRTIKGQDGFWRIPSGIAAYVALFFEGVRVAVRDQRELL